MLVVLCGHAGMAPCDPVRAAWAGVLQGALPLLRVNLVWFAEDLRWWIHVAVSRVAASYSGVAETTSDPCENCTFPAFSSHWTCTL